MYNCIYLYLPIIYYVQKIIFLNKWELLRFCEYCVKH